MQNSLRFLNKVVDNSDRAMTIRGFTGSWILLWLIIGGLQTWSSIRHHDFLWKSFALELALFVAGFILGRAMMRRMESALQFLEIDDTGITAAYLGGVRRSISWSDIRKVSVRRVFLLGTDLTISTERDRILVPPTVEKKALLLDSLRLRTAVPPEARSFVGKDHSDPE